MLPKVRLKLVDRGVIAVIRGIPEEKNITKFHIST